MPRPVGQKEKTKAQLLLCLGEYCEKTNQELAGILGVTSTYIAILLREFRDEGLIVCHTQRYLLPGNNWSNKRTIRRNIGIPKSQVSSENS